MIEVRIASLLIMFLGGLFLTEYVLDHAYELWLMALCYWAILRLFIDMIWAALDLFGAPPIKVHHDRE